MDLPSRREQASKGEELPSFMTLCRLPAENMTLIRLELKIWIKGVYSYFKNPGYRIRNRPYHFKSLKGLHSYFDFYLIPNVVDNQE